MRTYFTALAAALTLGGAAMAGTMVTQDFDSPGTAYSLSNRDGEPPAGVMAGGPAGNFLRVTYLGDNDNNNRIEFSPVIGASAYTRISARFDLRIATFPDKGADGLALVFLSTASYGSSGSPQIDWEEANLEKSLAVSFDYFENEVDDHASQVSVHWDSMRVAQRNTFDGANGDNMTGGAHLVGRRAGGGEHPLNDPFIRAGVEVEFVSGGANVDLVLTKDSMPFTMYDGLFVAGMTPYDTRVVLGARTGGLAGQVDVDNFSVEFTSVPEPAALAMLGCGALLLVRRRQ